jgi:hypothetical protein
MFRQTPWPQLSQGDLFDGIQISESLTGGKKKEARYRVIVLSHGCEIDKRDNHTCLCARIVALDNRPPTYVEALRIGDVANAMYLAPIAGWGEAYVDFRFIFRVHRSQFQEAAGSPSRVASMSEAGQFALQIALFAFFGRVVLSLRVVRLLALYTAVSEALRRTRKAIAAALGKGQRA